MITDKVVTLDQPTQIRWAMMTKSKVTPITPQEALLEQNGKNLSVKILDLENGKWEVKNVSNPPHDWERDNPGANMLYFSADLSSNQEVTFSVEFTDVEVNP